MRGVVKKAAKTSASQSVSGITYRTVCQNPGCGYTFDLNVTPENASILSGTLGCPRCRRKGGMLRPQGRIGERLFAAQLVFRMTGLVGPADDEDETLGEAR
ncbi:MAG: hypothetical protein M1336_07605 [Deltaproteobacteria bacterium]|jgi:hypothetical protein|nr:hypothetical protein [Deltaproteobacteria bacterium]